MGLVQASSQKITQPHCVPCPADYAPGNPGTFEELHKNFKDLYPCNFEGVRLLVRKTLNQHLNACHTITMSSITPSGYKFGACYVGSKHVGISERYPALSGDIAPNGNLATSFSHTLGCRLRLRNFTQMSRGKCQSSTSVAEYRTDDCTLSLILADPDLKKQSGTLVLHYLQALSSCLTLGVEMACHRSQNVAGGQRSIMTLAMRYSTGLKTFSATVGEVGMHFCYHRKVSQQLQLGAECEINTRTHTSTGTLVYQLDIPHADAVFKGLVNTDTTIGGVFEKKLYPIPQASLFLSAMLNHRKQQFRVGIGLNVG